MTRDEYIKAILRKTRLDRRTKKRLEADLAGDVDARLEAGERMEQVVAAMGGPAQVALQLEQSMGGAAVRKSPWRWVFLGLAVALVAAIIWSALSWAAYGEDLLAQAERELAYQAQRPDTHSVEIVSYGFGLPFTSALGLALGALGTFLLMQWKGVAKPGRLLAVGVAGVLFAAFQLAGGLSGALMESFLPVHSTAAIFAARFVNPAFLAPLLVGIVALRRWAKLRKMPLDA